MSMMRKLFRPGAGQKHARYTAAFVSTAATLTCHRGDAVFWDTTAPTSQGASGVVDGKTLTANDFVFVTTARVAATVEASSGMQAGVVEGLSIGDRDTVTTIPNDSLIIVQTYGVFDDDAWILTSGQARHAATDIATDATAGGKLFAEPNATFEGEMTLLENTDADGPTTDAIHNLSYIGFSLTAGAINPRGASTLSGSVTAFICNCD